MFINCYTKNLEDLEPKLLNQWISYLRGGNPSSIFNEFFNGQKNFITKKIESYCSTFNKDKTFRLIYELSSGNLDYRTGSRMYGNTFIECNLLTGEIRRTSFNKCLFSKEESREYRKEVYSQWKESFNK